MSLTFSSTYKLVWFRSYWNHSYNQCQGWRARHWGPVCVIRWLTFALDAFLSLSAHVENWSGIIGLFGVYSLTCSYGLCTGKFWKLLKTAAVSTGLCWRQYWSYLAQKKWWSDHYLECHSSPGSKGKILAGLNSSFFCLEAACVLGLLGEEHFLCSFYSSVWVTFACDRHKYWLRVRLGEGSTSKAWFISF